MSQKSTKNKLQFFDFAPWNFIIFLGLGLILIVVVATALQNGATNLGVQAGFVCPTVNLKNLKECRPGWKVDYSKKCPRLTCPVEPVIVPAEVTEDSNQPVPTRAAGQWMNESR